MLFDIVNTNVYRLVRSLERHTTMKSIYLDWTAKTNEYYVTDEDYWNNVRPLVMKLRVCAICTQYYDPAADPPRPCVGMRICQQCFLQKRPELHFLAVKSVNGEGETTYAFIDNEGQIYTSTENHSEEPLQDISYSLQQQGFLLPTRYTPFKAAEEVFLSTAHFTVFGDLQTASVLVADYNDFSDKLHITLLLYKNGSYKELIKKREGKVLLERAEAMLYQSKQPDGYYLIDGRKQSRIWQSDIYNVISRMETAMYNLSIQFAQPVQEQGNEGEAAIVEAQQSEEIVLGRRTPAMSKEVRMRRGRQSRLTIVQSPVSRETDISDAREDLQDQHAEEDSLSVHLDTVDDLSSEATTTPAQESAAEVSHE